MDRKALRLSRRSSECRFVGNTQPDAAYLQLKGWVAFFHCGMMSEDTLNELTRAVGRIEGKLDAFLTHETRISNLEKWRSWTAGIALALSLKMVGPTVWRFISGG